LTMLTIVPEWLRLFFWPASLSADYSFPRTRLATSFSLEMIPGLIVLISGLLIAFKMRRDKPIVSFSFAWIAITMAIPSNLIMTTGFVLAERTLFLASAGVALLAAAAAFTLHKAVQDSRHGRLTFHAAVVALLILGLVRSGVRMPVWANNLTLFTQTVADAPLSAHAHWMLAETLEKAGRRNDAADEMLKAVVLGRKNDFILLGYGGDLLARGGMCNRAMPLYRRALALTPQNQILRSNAALCLIELRKPEEARTLALAGGEGNQLLPQLASTLHLADSLTQLRTSASPVAGYVSN